MLDDLYREIILDHYKSPKNRGELDCPDIRARGLNPLCGDELELTVHLDGDRIESVKFQGHGCSISQASASILTERVKGLRLSEAGELADLVRDLLKGAPDIDIDDLGDLEALRGVRKFPVRIKCATLAWNALQLGIKEARKDGHESGEPVDKAVFTET